MMRVIGFALAGIGGALVSISMGDLLTLGQTIGLSCAIVCIAYGASLLVRVKP